MKTQQCQPRHIPRGQFRPAQPLGERHEDVKTVREDGTIVSNTVTMSDRTYVIAPNGEYRRVREC